MRDGREQEVKNNGEEREEKGKHTQSLSAAALKCPHIFAKTHCTLYVCLFKHDAKQGITSVKKKTASQMFQYMWNLQE